MSLATTPVSSPVTPGSSKPMSADEKYPRPEVGSTHFEPADPTLDARTAGQWALMTIRYNPNRHIKDIDPIDDCWSHVWSYRNPNLDEGNNARMAWRVYRGPLVHRLISHTCATAISDTCCNPDHLANVSQPLPYPKRIKSWHLDGTEYWVDNTPYIEFRSKQRNRKSSRGGRGRRGAGGRRGKLTTVQVRELRKRYRRGDAVADIAADYNINIHSVWDAALGKAYKDVPGRVLPGERPIRHRPKNGPTEAQVVEMRRRYHEGHESRGALAREFGLPQSTIQSIVTGRAYKHVGGLKSGHLKMYPGRRRFTNAEARDIKRRLRASESQTSVARRYGVSQAAVWRIAHGHVYADVMEPEM